MTRHTFTGVEVKAWTCEGVRLKVGTYTRVCRRFADEVRMMKAIPKASCHVQLICWVIVKDLLFENPKLTHSRTHTHTF